MISHHGPSPTLYSPPLDQTILVFARLHWWADVSLRAIMLVARCGVDVPMCVRAFWASTSSWTEHHKGSALRSTRAVGVAWTPRAKGAKAHHRAILGVAVLCDGFELPILAILPSILGHGLLHEISRLRTTTTLLSACRPRRQFANTIHRARRAAFLGVRCLITEGARNATMGFVVSDVKYALCDTKTTQTGTIAELCPMSVAVLWATHLIAAHLLDLTVSVRALQPTVLGGHTDGECTRADAHRTTIETVGAILIAITPFAPYSFAIDWAWVLSASTVFDVFDLFAFATSMVRLHINDVLSRLTATTTG